MTILTKRIIFLALLFISTSLFANVASVVALKGKATIVRNNSIIELTKKSILLKHDQINTKNNSKVQLLFKDETIISIGKNSSFKIYNYLFDEKNKKYEARFDMFKGTFKTITGRIGKLSPNNFNLKTKTASIGIRGTQIVMNLSDNKEEIFCTEGKILVTKLDSKISSIVNAGEFTSFGNKEDTNNNQRIKIKKIKKSDINRINNSITMENNLASDKITIKNNREKLVLNQRNINNNSNRINRNPSLFPNRYVRPEENDTEDQIKEKQEEQAKSNELKKEQEEQAKSNETTAAQAATEIEAAIPENPILISENLTLLYLTSDSYIDENKSKITYNGDFNNYTFDSKSQYLKKLFVPIQIPSSTTISMDIDFAASKDQISNGKIEIKDTPLNYYDTTFNFNGEIKNNSKFKLEGVGDTSGSGSGKFYGSEANLIQGDVDFKENIDNITIEGQFDAEKDGFDGDDYITIDDITPDSYFDDLDSTANYSGNFNNYSYDDQKQYFINSSGEKISIPTDTSISMNVDFGAKSDHITNGKIDVVDIGNSTSETLLFKGSINKSTFNLQTDGSYHGAGGKGSFYGPEANIMQGDINLKSNDSNIEIIGDFEAKKQ